MNEIVVGFGSHPSSAHTLDWAVRLAKRSRSHLTVLNVFHPAYIEMSPSTHEQLLEERQEFIEKMVAGTGHDDVEIAVIHGEALDELIRFADEVGADLIVVGERESMAPGGFGQHGAAEGLLRSSRIPFVVVPPDSPLPGIEGEMTVVVGVDGSKANAESVEGIARFVTDVGAAAIPLLSVNTGASTTRDRYGSHLLHEAEAEAIAARLPGHPTLQTINESPVEGLVSAAQELDASLIAIGTRGHWTPIDLIAGQLSRHVIHRADRAVLVAPHL